MLAEKPWKPEAVLGLGAGICACMLIGITLVTVLGRLFPEWSTARSNLVIFLVGALSFQGAALVWIHFFVRRHGMDWRQAFGFDLTSISAAVKWSGAAILVALPGAVLLGGLSEMLLKWLGHKAELQVAVQMLQHRPPAEQLVVYGFGAILLAPVAEELLFRGILYPTLKQSGHPQVALWVSSLLFAATHVNLLIFVPLTFLALILTWLYEKTGNLLIPILTHVAFNAVNFALLIAEPDWLRMG